MGDSLELGVDPLKNQDSMLESIESEALFFEFGESHGKNIQLSDDKRTAHRYQGYNHGIACVTKPLCKGHSISVSGSFIYTKFGVIYRRIYKMCSEFKEICLLFVSVESFLQILIMRFWDYF